jgi:uncharacterized protein
VKLHAAAPGARNVITAYGAGYVAVNGQRHDSSLIVMPDRVLPWDAVSFERLAPDSFDFVKSEKPEIVLLGTGPRQRFPDPKLTAVLHEARIGLEVMDVQAACRTYNILVAEERRVAAALLFE